MNKAIAPSISSLEEELEFSNVTDLRRDLLPVIERVAGNPAARVLILKHGRPQAVLMSSQTYDVLKKVVATVLRKSTEMTHQENIEAAFGRLQDDQVSSNATAEAVETETDAPKLSAGQ